MLIVYSF